MTSRDFCYWLQGFFEIHKAGIIRPTPHVLDAAQVDMIQKHLALVFKHEIDPSHGPAQDVLNKVHGSPSGVARC